MAKLPPPFTFFNRRRRARGGITLAEAEAVACRYGMGGTVVRACREYGVTPREALEDFDLIPPGATDEDVRLLAYTGHGCR